MENLNDKQYKQLLDELFYDELNEAYNQHPNELFETVNPRLFDILLQTMVKKYNNKFISYGQYKIFLSDIRIDISEDQILAGTGFSHDIYNKYIVYVPYLKTKLVNLLQIASSTKSSSGEDMQSTRNYLKQKYDINVDENGYILKRDFIRLLKAIYESIDELIKISQDANNYYSYIDNEENRRILEKEIYPDIQIHDLSVTDTRGYLELTYDQRINLGENVIDDGVDNAYKAYKDTKSRVRKD